MFQRCLERLKGSREKLRDHFRKIKDDNKENDNFVEDLMKDEWKCLRREHMSEPGDSDIEVPYTIHEP